MNKASKNQGAVNQAEREKEENRRQEEEKLERKRAEKEEAIKERGKTSREPKKVTKIQLIFCFNKLLENLKIKNAIYFNIFQFNIITRSKIYSN